MNSRLVSTAGDRRDEVSSSHAIYNNIYMSSLTLVTVYESN